MDAIGIAVEVEAEEGFTARVAETDGREGAEAEVPGIAGEPERKTPVVAGTEGGTEIEGVVQEGAGASAEYMGLIAIGPDWCSASCL